MKTELSLSDDWETPQELYDYLCDKYELNPTLDVAANSENCKCRGYLPYSLEPEISWQCNPTIETVWCNPPHSLNEQFVKKAQREWVKHNINIMMILPANSLCTNYAENYIHPYAEYHPINRKFCKFLHNGKVMDSSRNGYFVVIWRKK